MTLSALCVVASLLAADAEQEPAPTAEVAQVTKPPSWSVGAGVGFTFTSLGIGFSDSLAEPGIPSATLALERRVGRRSWLMLSLRGGGGQSSNAPEDTAAAAVLASRLSTQNVLASLGVRQSLLSERAPVDVSVIAILSFGYQRAVRVNTLTQMQPLGEPIVTESTTVNNLGTGGLGVGISAERMLLENLALRLTLGFAKVTYSAGRAQGSSLGIGGIGTTSIPQNISNISAGLVLEPGLELRLYF